MQKKAVSFITLVIAATSVFTVSGCSEQKVSATSPGPKMAPIRPTAQKKEPPKHEKKIVEVKGLHVTGWIAGGKKSFAHLVDLCDKTEINALCIDVKDSDGRVSFDTKVPLEREIHASGKMVSDIDGVLATMKKHDIYAIARIACFKDPVLAKHKPGLAVLNKSGGIWIDRHRTGWANPYNKLAWDYNIDLAIDCIKRGFDEIQWDYVRFPSDGRTSQCVYPGKTKASESEVITQFLKYAYQRLKPYNVVVTADIFGLTSLVKHDMGIGQTIGTMADHLDYICPMVYPSHYAHGEYGIPNPDVAPYKTVHLSLRDALARVKGTKCKIRPWLQDFSLYSHYGASEVLAQRKAAEELGIKEFILWNPRCKYTESALAREKKETPVVENKPKPGKA